ncbi:MULTISPECIES: prolyl oligopeptidase family serine peptidase [Pseudoalteromonas]|uniref:prolyl oligopeptidase n=2 Tax=Gammaproteobacteria TaxID=1236 RepID=A0ABD4EJI7_9GAMM|nr:MULTISPECIES: prolyl oligopeptidase family serine peptidase [Pseudoalteromonas]KYL31029.1 prolyl endopeptidase [Pseudoalteromonas spiralis]MDN3393680.1 prolyl oligopeptidase family serine peptidase [Pseudoalteromonas sp. APC 3215]MDN3400629.1 prolyl oligopeptidase family serine peptidase [Pseudoalteromonas sp. APC 3213]MDN3403572.1 prolyl oligopeptidase family serine peptidase [Pseudoalteromonas sp. APC 3218]MDN3407411.1 prolyl oligopeptidase family serine peptidase [Pseudoalteromonas sp. A|tara:strand:- start:67673 stop:69829 length:2157 start_codon:yes stop_codon:yes gene_type:complete
MLKKTLTCAVVIALAGCSQPAENTTQNEVKTAMKAVNSLDYPETKKGTVVDSYFGETVADPYRWLEDDMSDETAQWVKTQNNLTFSYLEQIPYRDTLKQRLEKLMNYEKISAPFTEGDYTYFYKNDGLQNQYVLYRSKDGGEAEIFLDPNTFSEDGTTSMSGLSFSEDGSLLAYQISEGGSDWRKIIVIDTETKEQVEQALVDVKFSGVSWLANDGFYYSSYDKPEGSELSAKTDQHKVYYHKLGQAQSEDTLVFGDTAEQKHRYVGAKATKDGRYLFISASVSTSGNKLFIKDLTKPDSEFVTVVGNTDSDTSVIDNEGSKLFLVTNLNAPNKKVVTVDASNPQPENWQDFIPETENVLNVTLGGNTFFANYMVDAISKVKQYNKQGELIRDISLPGVGTAGGFGGKKEQTTLYYSFTNYKTPGTTYSFDVQSGESKVYRKSGIDFNSDKYTSEQVFYTSKDGTKVPMIITYKSDIKLDGSNPTILYGYGGFNISLTPRFSSTTAAWLEQGGVYAVANIRGGGEYGKEWHKAGTQLQKQNVFDDFIAAAQYLQDKKYTSKKRLALRGGSNGGLLVGAVMTQRPDLFQVALPAVGVLDMLRYHTFTAGAGWAYDYGTSDQSKEMFDYLKGYSPIHNVKAGVEYPATMITTGDHDDRVVPSHSFKFAAELQAKQAGTNPTLIRIETNAGHGAGTPTSKIIDLYADMYGFTLYNMGIKSL